MPMGAITGDVIGSRFEFNATKQTDFSLFAETSRFTDDSVLTVATCEALLRGEAYGSVYRRYTKRFPNVGYGSNYLLWAMGEEERPSYGSYGNGSAMRVSPVGWVRRTLEETLAEAKHSADPTHSHPEGIKGAQATAGAIFLARTGASKGKIKRFLTRQIGYKMDRSIDEIRPDYSFDVTCQGSVPEALQCFLEGESYEEVIRLAVSLGGDSDTQAAIAGGVAEAFFGGVPDGILQEVEARLDPLLLKRITPFVEQYVSYKKPARRKWF